MKPFVYNDRKKGNNKCLLYGFYGEKQKKMHLWKFKISQKRIVPGILTAAAGIFVAAMWYFNGGNAQGKIVINEACSNNFSVICDENNVYSDYVELYNPGNEEVFLEGIFLSDDGKKLQKHSLAGISLPAKSYALIWLDGSQEGAPGHASFRLSKDGEGLYLSNQEGKILDYVMIPALSYNTSYARTEDGLKQWEYMSPTPGTDNADGQVVCAVTLKEPVFSAESGFYEQDFLLELEAAGNERIYYTLDGSDPDGESLLYQEPIPIGDASLNENVYAKRTDLAPSSAWAPSEKVDKATVVRAVCYDPDKNRISRIVTKVYFVGFSQKEEYDGMPVLALASDPDNLFDPEYGIYTNGKVMEEYKEKGGLCDGELLENFVSVGGTMYYRYMASNAYFRGKEWERESNITYFDSAHDYCFSQNVGIRISGQSTRGAPQKSLNIYGRDIYSDAGTLPYSFFPGTTYSTIKLRNGGSENRGSKIMDAFLQSLAADRDVSVQASLPCVMFLNGEYWGIYNIRERYTEEYLSEHYGVSRDNVWLIDSGSLGIGSSDAMDAYEQMISFVSSNDMSLEENYQAACALLDVQSLIDYLCINFYIDNTDISFTQNMALWRTREAEENPYGDCRWRWMVFDVDKALAAYDSNTFESAGEGREDYSLLNEPLVSGLMANAQFRRQFCLTFMDIANVNYAYRRVHDSLEEWKKCYEPQVIKSHQRFFEEDFEETEYEELIKAIDDFFKNRYSFIAARLAEKFGLTGSLETVRVSVNEPEGGTVIVNTSPVNCDPEWSGQYYTDYPVTVTAAAEEGWYFAGWSGDVSGQDTQLEVELPAGGATLYAEFQKMKE